MVKIARLGPGGTRLTTRTGVAPRSLEAETRVSRAAGGFLKTVQDVAQRFETLASENEIMQSKNEARTKLADLERQAVADPDAWDTEKYTTAIAKIKEETSKNVSLPAVRNRYEFEYDALSLTSSTTIQNTLRKKQIVDAQVNMFDAVDLMGEEYASITDPRVKQAKINEMEETFRNAVDMNLLTPLQARSNIEAQKKKWIEQDIRNKIAEDPDLAEEMLLGDTWELSSAETSEWGNAIEKQRKANEKKAEKIRNDIQVEGDTNLVADIDAFSVEDIVNNISNDRVSARVGLNIIDYKREKDSTSYETDKQIYMEMFRDMVTPGKDIRKFNEVIARELKNGNIQKKDTLNTTIFLNNAFRDAVAYKTQDNTFMKNMRASMDFISDWAIKHPSRLTPTDVTFDLTNELIRRIQEERTPAKDIPELAQELVKDQIRADNPEIVVLDDIPNAKAAETEDLDIIFEEKSQVKPTHEWRDGKLIKV